MSRSRVISKAPFAGQRGRCSWCGSTDIPKGRRNWCSQACVDAYMIRKSPGHVRDLVHRRDKGICSSCGIDSDAAYREWVLLRMSVYRLADRLISSGRWHQDQVAGRWEWRNADYPSGPESKEFRAYLLAKYAPGNWTEGRNSGWDADHIVPVVEGGGECDLSNYRTLCHPCHKQVTADLAARLAESRRREKRRAAGDLFEAAP